MHLLIRYGKKQVLLGLHDPYPFQCPNCKQLNTVNFMLWAQYYHVWYIPIFPFEKDGYARCENCDFKVDSLRFSRYTRDDFTAISKGFRYPFYTYIGAAFFILPIILAIIISAIEAITGQ